MVALKGDSDIGNKINTQVIQPLIDNNSRLARSDFPDFNDPNKLGEGKEKVDRLTNLISIFQKPELDFSKNRAEHDDILGDAYEYLMRHFASESGKSKGQFYTPAEVMERRPVVRPRGRRRGIGRGVCRLHGALGEGFSLGVIVPAQFSLRWLAVWLGNSDELSENPVSRELPPGQQPASCSRLGERLLRGRGMCGAESRSGVQSGQLRVQHRNPVSFGAGFHTQCNGESFVMRLRFRGRGEAQRECLPGRSALA